MASNKRKKIIPLVILAILAEVILAAAVYFAVTKIIMPNIRYNTAMSLMEKGRYNDAIEAFELMGGYKDSEDKIENCRETITQDAYKKAESLMKKEKYAEAIEAFEDLEGYKDSNELAKECLFFCQQAELTDIYVESEIKFGYYEQDNNTQNGKEEIEWIVLAVEENRALVVSKYALDCRGYNAAYTNTTWENSTLRIWLNESFLIDAFSDKHRDMILSSSVSNDNNPNYGSDPGSETIDKVFLLSINEVYKYFPDDEALKCVPTEYAKEQGAYINDSDRTEDGRETCWWWLRTPGIYQDFATAIYQNGTVNYFGYGVSAGDGSIRPAIWINLES